MDKPATIYLKDYRPPSHRIVSTELTFEIFEEHTLVINRMQVESLRNETAVLRLDGDGLTLLCVKVDDEKLPADAYEQTAEYLEIFSLPPQAAVQVVTKIYPDKNSELEGLYRSGGIFCTQNEPHGFRRITFFLDRPDNMSVFTTKVIAEKARYPVLLSNGNLIGEESFDDGRHCALWHDPFPKPSYLFALVAGDLAGVSDRYTTAEGKDVVLNIYVDRGNETRCIHAMRALKAAMKWDEEVYGRCYDLSVYNIVAVDSFNMGAMENKGLNIFNSHYVLADAETATDSDFLGIESVIAHEYFHNWTGNRITCRDWFQLTLKEGLTVFRDQSFSADRHSPTVQRIHDVKTLRERQFPEDAGPTAHPIKPDHYIEINNFYTATVYEKGAEVIRMLHTLLGPQRWRRAMDLYFDTFDAKAVTTEEFLWAVQQYSPIDLTQFSLWYSQERTPQLVAAHSYDRDKAELTLRLKQIVPDRVDGRAQKPYCFPLRMALLRSDGTHFDLDSDKDDQPLLRREILLVRKEEETFVFRGCDHEPVLSLNRHFSAPISLRYAQEDVVTLMRRDDDGFNRYEAAQSFAQTALQQMMRGEPVHPEFPESFGSILEDTEIDPQFKALLLELPAVEVLMQTQKEIDVFPIIEAREALARALARKYERTMRDRYQALHRPQNEALDARSMGERALKNCLLGYLMTAGGARSTECALSQYRESLTMTDRYYALTLLENFAPEAAESVLRDFYVRYNGDMLVMTKYLGIIAGSRRPGTLGRVKAMLDDPVFDIKVPNLVRALIGTFARNPRHFHAKDGSGYDFVAEKIVELDGINPMIAAGLAGAFKSYARMNPASKRKMKTALERIMMHGGLSKNVFEIVGKILAEPV